MSWGKACSRLDAMTQPACSQARSATAAVWKTAFRHPLEGCATAARTPKLQASPSGSWIGAGWTMGVAHRYVVGALQARRSPQTQRTNPVTIREYAQAARAANCTCLESSWGESPCRILSPSASRRRSPCISSFTGRAATAAHRDHLETIASAGSRPALEFGCSHAVAHRILPGVPKCVQTRPRFQTAAFVLRACGHAVRTSSC